MEGVDEMVLVESVKNMFPNYQPLKKVRGYHTTRCTDPLVEPFMYPHWLAAHHMWPHKDEFPLYFCKQLFVEFHLHQELYYTDILGHARQDQGRFSYKFKDPDAPVLINKWALIGPNLLVMPKCFCLAST